MTTICKYSIYSRQHNENDIFPLYDLEIKWSSSWEMFSSVNIVYNLIDLSNSVSTIHDEMNNIKNQNIGRK